jgi:putative peptidoglycan lipid II flippase
MYKKFSKLHKSLLTQDVIKTTILSTSGKSIGFLIPFFIAAWFGISQETDVFFFAYGIVLFMSFISAPAMESMIVPYITEARVNDENVGKFVGSILCVSSIGLVAISVLFVTVAMPILSVVTRFNTQDLKLILQLLIETSPLIVLLTWTSILAGAMNAYKEFVLPAISPVFRTVACLIVIFLLKGKFGIHSIAFGYVIGEIVRLAVLFLGIYKKHLFDFSLSIRFSPILRQFLKTSSYQAAGIVVIAFHPVIDRIMASWLKKGDLSILEYANRLYMIPRTVFVTGLLTVLLSEWSIKHSQYKDISILKSNVWKSCILLGILAFCSTGLLILISPLVLKIAYGYGNFSKDKLELIKYTWFCFLIGLTPYLLWQLVARAIVVVKKTSILMFLLLMMTMVKLLFNFLLIEEFGVGGLALATSAANVWMLLTMGIVFYIMPLKAFRKVKEEY